MAGTGNTQPAKNGSGSFKGVTMKDLRDITIDQSAEEKAYASSSTAGKIKREVGHEDKSGSFTAYVPKTPTGSVGDSVLGFKQGDSGALVLKSNTNQTLYNEDAVIISLGYEIPVEGGDLVAVTVNWGRC